MSWTIKRLKHLLIPFLVWSTFYMLINTIMEKNDFNVIKTVTKLLLGLSSGHLYYILVLLQLTIMTPLLIKIIKTERATKLLFLVTPVYLVCLYFYAIGFKNQFPFYQTLFPAWFIFYFVGLLIKIKGYTPKLNSSIEKSILFCFVAFFFSVIEGYWLLSAGLSVGFASSQIKVSSFIYTFTIINLLLVIKPYMENLKFWSLKFIENNSFGIYYVHMFWIMVSGRILSNILIIDGVLPIYQFIQVIIVLVLSCISILVTNTIIGKSLFGKMLGF